MKKTSILLVALFTVCAALPAAAQGFDTQSLQGIKDAVLPYATSPAKKHEFPNLDSISQKVQRAVKKKPLMQEKNDTQATCEVCGAPINTEHRHAPAENTNLCNECQDTAYRAAQPQENIPSVCPHCGQMYTIDEKYHNVPHVCPEGTAPTCAACGETITDPHQHCAATNYTGLCSSGDEPHNNEQPNLNECPNCHAPYTMEEQHHSVPHVCKKSENNETK